MVTSTKSYIANLERQQLEQENHRLWEELKRIHKAYVDLETRFNAEYKEHRNTTALFEMHLNTHECKELETVTW